MPRPEPLEEDEEVAFRAAADAFNRGEYYAAHDAFEALWGEDFWKGLVMASVALHHWSVGNVKGIDGLPEKVDEILSEHTPAYHGMDVAGFLETFQAFIGEVQAGNDPDAERVPRIRFVAEAS